LKNLFLGNRPRRLFGIIFYVRYVESFLDQILILNRKI